MQKNIVNADLRLTRKQIYQGKKNPKQQNPNPKNYKVKQPEPKVHKIF